MTTRFYYKPIIINMPSDNRIPIPNIHCNFVFATPPHHSEIDTLISQLISTRKTVQNIYLQLNSAIQQDDILTQQLAVYNIHV